MLFKRRNKVDIPDDLLKILDEVRTNKKSIKRIYRLDFELPSMKNIHYDEECVDYELPQISEITNTKLDKSFKELLFFYIDRSGNTDSYIYNKARVSRKVFSKIRNEYNKKVSKKTAICLGLALELDIDEFNELLKANGDILADNNYFDVAIKWCINNKIYNIDKVNDILYSCNIELLVK